MDDSPLANGWKPAITLLQSTRQMKTFPPFQGGQEQNHEKLCFLCLKPVRAPAMLSHGQPGTDYFCCLKPLRSPCCTAGTAFPDRQPDTMVWCLVRLVPHGYHQNDIPGPHPAAGRNRQEANKQRLIHHLLQKPLSSSRSVSNVTKPRSAEAKVSI